MSGVDDLQRIGLKVFLAPESAPDPATCIPVFHRWIRESVIEGVLIDVADYTHLSRGPKVLLVGHEANLALDEADGRPGLVLMRKQAAEGSFAERVTALAGQLLRAASALEEEPSLPRPPRFSGQELQFIANDRLQLPGGAPALAAVTPALEALMQRLHAGAAVETADATVGGGRLRVSLTAGSDPGLTALVERLA